MFEAPIAGLKLAAPKLLSGAILGLPLTLVIGPGVGIVVVGAFGLACLGGYWAAADSLARLPRGSVLST